MEKASCDMKIKDTDVAIKKKKAELEENKKMCGQAELLDRKDIASKLYAEIKRLDTELEQLQSKRKILERANSENEKPKTVGAKLAQAKVKQEEKAKASQFFRVETSESQDGEGQYFKRGL